MARIRKEEGGWKGRNASGLPITIPLGCESFPSKRFSIQSQSDGTETRKGREICGCAASSLFLSLSIYLSPSLSTLERRIGVGVVGKRVGKRRGLKGTIRGQRSIELTNLHLSTPDIFIGGMLIAPLRFNRCFRYSKQFLFSLSLSRWKYTKRSSFLTLF